MSGMNETSVGGISEALYSTLGMHTHGKWSYNSINIQPLRAGEIDRV